MQNLLTENQARQELVEVSRLCYQRGYICGTEGNFSIRLADNLVLTTPAGTCKGRLCAEDLVLTDLNGNSLSEKKPSTELKMHLVAYQTRSDVYAVVHAHPTVAVGFTVAGVSLAQCVLPEVVCTLGHIPTAPYATPSTSEIPDSIRDFVAKYDAIMLDHHGALTLGKDIFDAYYKLETVEHFAQTMLVAHQLGGPKPLYKSQVQKLLNICSVYGLNKPANSEQLVTAGFCQPDVEN
ncbi:MAG TPA: class II aldolase/adducin family protein [Drouetiella sp.]